MEYSDAIRLWILAGGVSLLIWKRQQLERAIRAALDRMGGGPPTPMHPLPASDTALLSSRTASARPDPRR